MLILSRKERERIKLGDSIVVTVVRLSGDRVRLGIEAPADILVLREELDPFDKPSSPAGLLPAPLSAPLSESISESISEPVAASA